MMYLRTFRLLKSPKGNIRKLGISMKGREVKWDNDFNDFNIFDRKSWRNYLANDFTFPNGNKLPSKTSDGEPVVYEVYVMGASKFMLEGYGGLKREGKVGCIFLFPGYDKEGKRLSVEKHGWIRK